MPPRGSSSELTPAQIVEQWVALLRRTRHVTGPPLVALVLACLASVAYTFGTLELVDGGLDGEASTPWALVAFLVLWVWALWVGVASVFELPVRSAAKAPAEGAGRLERWVALGNRHAERVFAAAAWGLGGVWSLLVALLGPSLALAGAGFVCLVPLWAAWFRHRRIRLAVVVEQDVDAWGDGSEVGLPGTAARALSAGAGWFKVKVTPATGKGRRLHTHDEYRQAVARVAALFRVRARDVRMGETDDEGAVTYTVSTAEREVAALSLDLEPVASIVGEKRLGMTDDGEIVHTAYVLDGRDGKGAGGQHGMTVGRSGSGKSSEAHVDCAHAARALDTGLIVWDFSYGAAELRGWFPCAWWFCTTPDQALDSLRWLIDYAEHRGKRMRGRFHRPSRKRPAVVLVTDETASMFAPELIAAAEAGGDPFAAKALADLKVQERVTVWEGFTRLARKYSFSIRTKTQYGVDAAIGGETAKQQLGTFRSVFKCNRDQDAAQVVPLALARTSLFPDKPGTCHHIGPTTPDGGVRLRVDYHDDGAIAALSAALASRQPLPERAMREHPLWLARPTSLPLADEHEGELDDVDELDEDELDDEHEGELDDDGAREVVVDAVDVDEHQAASTPSTSASTTASTEPSSTPSSASTGEPEPASTGELSQVTAAPASGKRRRMAASTHTLAQVRDELAGQGWRSSGELAAALSLSSRTVSGCLRQLADEGSVERKGKGPTTRYRRPRPSESWGSASDGELVGQAS